MTPSGTGYMPRREKTTFQGGRTVTTQQSELDQQQDPRGDLLKERPGGETEPGGWIPPYEGRTTGTHEFNDSSAGADTGGLGQATGQDIDDLDMAHHKGKPEDSEPELVPNEGKALYPKA
jgi:hypothetical protein